MRKMPPKTRKLPREFAEITDLPQKSMSHTIDSTKTMSISSILMKVNNSKQSNNKSYTKSIISINLTQKLKKY